VTRLLNLIREAAVRWALVMAAVITWLVLGAALDGPSETDALQASAADLAQAPADERAAMRGPR
jgi:hypothetical protein